MNVYSRFGGKDGVLDELFVDGFRRLAAKMEASPSSDDPMADLRQCGACYRQFARENPTYYSLMFDRVVPDFEPSEAAVTTALGSLGELAARVQRAMDAGRCGQVTPSPSPRRCGRASTGWCRSSCAWPTSGANRSTGT